MVFVEKISDLQIEALQNTLRNFLMFKKKFQITFAHKVVTYCWYQLKYELY